MVGLLLDSLSQNTGDQAILHVMVSFLKKEQRAFDILSPLRYDAQRYQPIIVGGGHLLRPRGDWFYDAFRVAGPHMLNAVGLSTSEDLDYLREYVYVSVRSRGDLARVAALIPTAVVCPCVGLRLSPDIGPSLAPQGCIGFHFHDQSWAAVGDESLFLEYADYPQCLIPITYYNNDLRLLRWLQDRIPHKLTLLPRLPPRAVLREISRMRALVCSSLHAALFAYSQNVPFLAFGAPEKIVEFMKDRGLERWVFSNSKELRAKLAALLHLAPDYTSALQRDMKRLDEHFIRLASYLPQASQPAWARTIESPDVEHRLLIEHHNRIDALESMVDRLHTRGSQLMRELAREDSRITELQGTVEASMRAQTSTLSPSGTCQPDLPFGVIESPVSSTVVTDRCQVTGWALSAGGVSEVRAYLDGRLATSAGDRESRPDVARAYPGFPDNPYAGWTITLDLVPLPKGLHELVVQARSRSGSSRDLGVLSIVKIGAPGQDGVSPVGEQETGTAQRQNQGQERSESLSQSLQCLLGRAAELERAHEQLRGRLDDLDREVFDVGRSLDALPVALEVVRDDLGALGQAVSTLQASAGATEAESLSLSSRLSSFSAEVSSMSAGVSDLTESVSRLECHYSHVNNLEDQHRQFQDRLEGLNTQASELRHSLHALQGTLEAARGALGGLWGSLATLETGAGTIQNEMSAMRDGLASLSARMSSLSVCLSGVSQRADRNELTAQLASEEVASRFDQLSRRMSAVDSLLQFNATQLGAIYASRIWRALKMIAAPFDLLLRLSRAHSSQARLSPASGADRPSASGQTPGGLEAPPLGAPQSQSLVTHLPPAPPPPATAEAEAGAGPSETTLQVGIESEIPATIPVGEGTVINVSGWCYHPKHRIAKLEIAVGGARHPAKLRGLPRPDVHSIHFPHVDPKGRSFSCGFWSLVPIPKRSSHATVDFVVHATLANGQECAVGFARATLAPACPLSADPIRAEAPDPNRPLVVICLATYNPPLDLFTRQIQSLIEQSYANWIAVISDDGSSPAIYDQICAIVRGDPRFHVRRVPQHLGFYGNFEHCLSLVPPEAQFVALCDQDDYWHADKLDTLLAAFRPGTALVYSDMNIVDEGGRVLSTTYWSTRRNNYTNFTSLLVANTITGAASMFRRSLLETLLPFPRTPGVPFHDHWIGCMALATGDIAYVNRPLYDYVQHHRSVIGHFTPRGFSWFQNLRILLRDPRSMQHALEFWRSIYFGDVLRLETLAAVIRLRAADQLSPSNRRTLDRLERLDACPTAPIWLALRLLRRVWRGNETLAAETRLLRGVLWKHLSVVRARLARPPTAAPLAQPTPAPSPPSGIERRLLAGAELIREKTAPLSLRIRPGEIQRVNLLVPTIDLAYFFGGYLAKFNLARRLAGRGFAVRILIVDHCYYRPDQWRSQLRECEGLQDIFDSCELTYAYDRRGYVPVSSRDVFIATTWWTAYIARAAAHQLGRDGFLYLIQEYEPFTFSMGSFACMAAETYNWPHYALFSTSFLRDYFCRESLGVYAPHAAGGEVRAAVFNNAITHVEPVSRENLASRQTRKLLFYARPEDHAARNMFELGVLALGTVIEAGGFADSWEFTGVGAVTKADRVPLAGRRYLRLLQRRSQAQYSQLLAEHDLGLSLMYTPHPSLVPIEMAASGMVVITNTFGNKTAEGLGAISRNIVPVQPSLEALAAGLREGVARVEDYEARALGSRVDWPRNWEEALNAGLMDRVSGFLRDLAQ